MSPLDHAHVPLDTHLEQQRAELASIIDRNTGAMLPLYHQLTECDQDRVVDALACAVGSV